MYVTGPPWVRLAEGLLIETVGADVSCVQLKVFDSEFWFPAVSVNLFANTFTVTVPWPLAVTVPV